MRPDTQLQTALPFTQNVHSHTRRFVILPTLLHPGKTGRVLLSSSDPFTHPDIDPNYLEDRNDIATYLEGVRFLCFLFPHILVNSLSVD